MNFFSILKTVYESGAGTEAGPKTFSMSEPELQQMLRSISSFDKASR
jgi:hypothetical protein